MIAHVWNFATRNICVCEMLRLDSATKLKWEVGPGGLLTSFITLGVADQKLEYYEPRTDGTGFTKTIECISLEQLKRDDTLASARGLPINLGHPVSGRHNLNAENLLVGSTLQEVAFDGPNLVLASTFQDARADRLIKEARDRTDGLMPEISPGYTIERLERNDGVGWQVGRIFDHVALLLPGEGRGKQGVRVRLDAADRIALDLVPEDTARNLYFVPNNKKKPMPIISIGKRVYNLDDASDLVALKPAVEKLAEDFEAAETLATEAETKATTATAQLTTETERADAATKEAETAKGRADALDVKVKEAENTRVDATAVANDRKDAIETWALCLPQLRTDNADFEPDYALAPTDIKRSYLTAKYPEVDLTEASEDRIAGMWEVAKPARVDAADSSAVDAFGQLISKQKAESSRNDGKAAKDKAAARAKRIKENGLKSTMGAAA